MSRVNGRRGKTHYSEALKQRLVDAAKQPGASLSKLAQQSGISISTLYKWRQQYQKLTTAASATLIPIAIQAAEGSPAAIEAAADKLASARDTRAPGVIEVILQRARIQICGLVNTEALRVVLKVCQESGNGDTLLCPRPLRTERATFTALRSSLSKAFIVTR